MARDSNSLIITAAKAAVAVGGLYYATTKVDLSLVAEAAAKANLLYLLLAVVSTLCGIGAASARWTRILSKFQIRLSIANGYRSYLIGNFYSLFLPGAVGGDIVRSTICHRNSQGPFYTIIFSTLIERYLGILSIFLLLSLGLTHAPTLLPQHLSHFIYVTTGVLLLLLLITPEILEWATRSQVTLMSKISAPLRSSTGLSRSAMLTALLFTVLFQLGEFLATLFIAKSFGITINVMQLLIALPLGNLAMILPITLAGIGIKEATLTYTLVSLGIAKTDAGIIALLLLGNRLVIGLIGAIDHTLFSKNFFDKK